MPIALPHIFIKRTANAMRESRSTLRSKWGDKYRSRVGVYTSLIRKEMVQRKCGAVDAARNFMGILKARKKLSPVLKMTIEAAALDVIENADGRNGEKRREVNVDVKESED